MPYFAFCKFANLSFQSLIPNPSFPLSQHISPLVLHIFRQFLSLLPTPPQSSRNRIPSPAVGTQTSSHQPTPPPLCSATQVAPLNESPTKFCTAMSGRRAKVLPTGHVHFCVVLLSPSIDTSPGAVARQGWRQVLLTASLTNTYWTSHSWEEQAREICLPLSALTLEETNANVTLWFMRTVVIPAFVLQHKQLKDLPLFSSEILLQGGEEYNALLWDTSVMEEQAGHIHVYGFKMGRTPGTLHSLQFSEVRNIFRSECRVTSALCRKPA